MTWTPSIIPAWILSISPLTAVGDTYPARPHSVHCRSPGAWGPAADFTIEQLQSEKPIFSDLDAGDDVWVEMKGAFTVLSGNNGCDDDYHFVFSTDDLELAAQGKRVKIHGLMNYFNGYMDETVTETLTAAITCEVTEK